MKSRVSGIIVGTKHEAPAVVVTPRSMTPKGLVSMCSYDTPTQKSKRGPKPTSVAERIAAKVELRPGSDCYWWTGAQLQTGYGSIYLSGKSYLAHRIVYELTHGHVLKGMVIRHKCHNRLCVNPEHLVVGSYSENNFDSSFMNRGEMNANAKLTQSQVDEIRDLYKGRGLGPSQKEIAERFKISQTHVSRIISRDKWKR